MRQSLSQENLKLLLFMLQFYVETRVGIDCIAALHGGSV